MQEVWEEHLEEQGSSMYLKLKGMHAAILNYNGGLFSYSLVILEIQNHSVFSSRNSGATSSESIRWNTEGQEGLPEGWTLQVFYLLL